MPHKRPATALGTLALVISLTACGGSSESPTTANTGPQGENAEPASNVTEDLLGTEWVLVSLYGHAPLEGTNLTLIVKDDGIEGATGCNRYASNSVTLDEDAFRADRVVSTKIGCSADVMRQEEAYLSALYDAASYRMQDGHLDIQDASGETTVIYETKG